MDIPATMRAAVLRAPGEPLSIETIPTPRPRANEVLLRVAACGLCHSDLHVLGGAIASIPSCPGEASLARMVTWQAERLTPVTPFRARG